jgi:hypothetical protein
MLGPVTIIMLDASDKKVLLAYKRIQDAVSKEASLSFFFLTKKYAPRQEDRKVSICQFQLAERTNVTPLIIRSWS